MKTSRIQTRLKSAKRWPTAGLAKTQEAAEFLNCARSTVYKMIQSGELKSTSTGSDKRIPWHVLWEYIGQPVQPPRAKTEV